MNMSKWSIRGIGRLATGLVLVALIQVFFLRSIPGVNATMPERSAQDTLREKVEFTGWAMAIKSYCPYCRKAVQMFRDSNIECDIWELDKDKNGKEVQNLLFDVTNQKTVPNIFHNGNHMGGFSDLEKAIQKAQSAEL